MKVSDSSNVRQSTSLRRRTSGGEISDFSGFLSSGEAGGAEGNAAPSGAGPVGNMDSLLVLQEVPDEEVRRKKTIAQGNSLLDALESLRQSLLIGAVPLDVLRILTSRLSLQRQQTADPQLHALMDEIELRAAVERAKLETALKNNDNTV